MPPISGEDFTLEVDTTVGGTDPATATFVVVEDMHTWSQKKNRGSQTFPVFNRTAPYSIAQKAETTFSVQGYLTKDDPGQVALRLAEETDTPILIRVRPEGGTTKGYTQVVRVTSRTHDAKSDGALQEISFDFIAEASPVAEASGGYVP